MNEILLSNGMISVANDKRKMIVPYITGVIKLTQRQDGDFLGMLAASLGIPLITSLLSRNGLQVDAQRDPYRQIPRVKKIEFQNKPLSNIEIEKWTKQVDIKNFRGVCSRNNVPPRRQKES